MIQDVFIIGAAGNVGKQVVRQILESNDCNPEVHDNPTRIVGLGRLGEHVFHPKGISEENSFAFIEGAGDVKKHESLSDILKEVLAAYTGDSSLVFIDVTAGKDALEAFHKEVIETTPFGIVTANKNPLTLSSFETFRTLTKDTRRYDFRCSVMAGAEAVSLLQDLNDVEDRPSYLSGIFSGTLGYIMANLESGLDFSEIVTDAHAKGYTEPDPRDDLNGFDVARKLLVLARISGFDVDLKDIKVEPFVPQSYFEAESSDAFLKNLSNLNAEFKTKFAESKKENMTPRYIAECAVIDGHPKLTVGWMEVPLDGPFGTLNGSMNKLVVISEAYPDETPYVVEAPGAGIQVTALNVRRGLLSLLPERRSA
jgi:aspartokinase/homoserine dehydrogenase 1